MKSHHTYKNEDESLANKLPGIASVLESRASREESENKVNNTQLNRQSMARTQSETALKPMD